MICVQISKFNMFNKDCNENNLLSFKEEYDVF